MKHLHALILILFLPLLSFAQSDYYVIDSNLYAMKVIDGGELNNLRLCRVKKGGEIIEYTPYEVSEYGFKDGRVFVSKEIQLTDSSKRVFLERLATGETTLYYYRGKGIKTFFIEKDSTLFTEMPKQNTAKEDYSEFLSNFTVDCPNVADASKLVSYNKRPLAKLITRYNKCELKPFPHFKYGVIIGYESSKLVLSDKRKLNSEYIIPDSERYLEYFDYKYDGGFSIGVFLDNPIRVSDFSVHAELLFSKNGYSYNKLVGNKDIDFVANLSSLKVPLLLRYAYPSNKIRPFINVGFIGTYMIKNETLLYETTIREGSIKINDTGVTSLISDIQLGYSIGGGIEYKLNFLNSLFLELRYNNQYSVGDAEFRGISALNVFTGINF